MDVLSNDAQDAGHHAAAPTHAANPLADLYATAPSSNEFQRLRRRLTRQVQAAIYDYSMISPGDHVMVCCSGGKDSYTLLTILRELSRRTDAAFQITAFHLDQGQPGYPAEVMPKYFQEAGVEHLIVREDTYAIVQEKIAPGKTTCALCSRLRRGLIYAKAAEIGATKIALGHHRDDAIETLLLNMFFGGRLKSMPPKLSALKGAHTLIRPLYYAGEEDVARFARALAYPIIPCTLCGSQPDLQRQAFKGMLADWEKRFPGRKSAIFKAMRSVVPSHLADTQLYDFHAMAPMDDPLSGDAAQTSAPKPADTAAAQDTAAERSADFFAQNAVRPQGFMAFLDDA